MFKFSDQFLVDYCNWGSLKTVCLSFDVDWAPDYMLIDVWELVKDVSPTIFATHGSGVLEQMSSEFDLGIHPNLTAGSSQGNGIDEVINFFKRFEYLHFDWCRFHLLGHSYSDLEKLSSHGVKFDSSYCLLNAPFILPHLQPDLDIVLAPYFWEDGLRLKSGVSDQFINWEAKGLKIFDFHPIDIYFNTPDIEARNKIKSIYKSVNQIPQQEAEKLINKSTYGTRDILIEVLQKIRSGRVHSFSLSEMSEAVRLNYV